MNCYSLILQVFGLFNIIAYSYTHSKIIRRFLNRIRAKMSGEESQDMLDMYSSNSNDDEFGYQPENAIQKSTPTEDLITTKLPNPVFTSNTATADLCLGCKIITILKFKFISQYSVVRILGPGFCFF
jgi:hypothetical protein